MWMLENSAFSESQTPVMSISTYVLTQRRGQVGGWKGDEGKLGKLPYQAVYGIQMFLI
jgi:hypothetical protein